MSWLVPRFQVTVLAAELYPKPRRSTITQIGNRLIRYGRQAAFPLSQRKWTAALEDI